MEAIAAAFARHGVEQAPGLVLLPSVRVEEALMEAGVRDLSVGAYFVEIGCAGTIPI